MTSAEFEDLVRPHRAALHAHCYRMLGSVADADDAVQDALVGAWKGIDRFEGRAKLRSWLFTIATNASLAILAKRRSRVVVDSTALSACAAVAEADAAAARAIAIGQPSTTTEVALPITEAVWIEPYPSDPQTALERIEDVELAFIAALQHLPATQRAAVLLRDVLEFSADETAALLETTVASANSALQRGRDTLARHMPGTSQETTLRDLGEPGQRELVESFIDAWERADIGALSALLARDAKFSMPPIPTWFDGADAIARFFGERVFATPWKLVPIRANGQLAFACYQRGAYGTGDDFGLASLAVIGVRQRRIAEITGFLDPAVHARFSLPPRISAA